MKKVGLNIYFLLGLLAFVSVNRPVFSSDPKTEQIVNQIQAIAHTAKGEEKVYLHFILFPPQEILFILLAPKTLYRCLPDAKHQKIGSLLSRAHKPRAPPLYVYS